MPTPGSATDGDRLDDAGRAARLAAPSVVLVATDLGPGGDEAVSWAARLADDAGALIVAVCVLEPGIGVATGGPGPVGSPPLSDREAVRAELAASVGARCSAARVEVRVVEGDQPAEAIVAEAEACGADVVVVESAGMRGRKQFLLGNVANRVTHSAPCTVVVVNTLGGASGRDLGPGASGVPEDATQRDRAAEISRALGGAVLQQFAGRSISGGGDGGGGPRALREAFESLGPTFGKIGQILSTRPDLLPPAYLDELASLQSHVPPMAEDEVVSVMEAELGVPWEDVFESIDPAPLAAGTIGQVHRATLVDGGRVVVKVQRPGAADLIDRDLKLFEQVIRPFQRVERARRVIDLPSLFDQLATSLRAELDFEEEARNLDDMAEAVRPYPRLGVPGCHEELSSRRLLVMDEVVGGVPVTDAPAGPAREEAARQLLHSYYRQVLEDGFFHADPHPGNLLWADDRIWLLDLGMVGRISAEVRQQLVVLLLAVANEDVDLLADVSIDLSGAAPVDLDLDAYRASLAEVVASISGQSVQDLQLGELLNRLTAISLEHRVPLPTSLVMVGKALAQVQQTVAELDPSLDPIDEAGRFFVQSFSRRAAGRLDPARLLYEAERILYRAGQVGEGLATIVGTSPGRQLQVQFSSQRLEHKVARAGRTVALGLSAGLTWVAAIHATGSDRIDPRTARGLRALATGLSAGLVVDVLRGD